jgi:hypothetical protein
MKFVNLVIFKILKITKNRSGLNLIKVCKKMNLKTKQNINKCANHIA